MVRYCKKKKIKYCANDHHQMFDDIIESCEGCDLMNKADNMGILLLENFNEKSTVAHEIYECNELKRFMVIKAMEREEII